jgi:hypothetical protein
VEVFSVKKLIVSAAAGFAGIAVWMVLASTGVASASPDVSGKTFSEAQSVLSGVGLTAVSTTAIGDKQAQGDCTVVRQQDVPSVAWQPPGWPAAGGPPTKQVLLTLQCYPPAP